MGQTKGESERGDGFLDWLQGRANWDPKQQELPLMIPSPWLHVVSWG